ncbi:unnamed protein product [Moneuplotes crassus]|uniref:Uncharacterized protein n=1 Tax=Euplotes crassus TaxID=5936 RepID=A0AAD1XZ75_EUPCR|nr:unnamed protein product [Moneuplotes crassus]
MGNCLDKLLSKRKKNNRDPNPADTPQMKQDQIVNQKQVYVQQEFSSYSEEEEFEEECSKDALYEDIEKQVQIEEIKVSIQEDSKMKRKSYRQHTAKPPRRSESMDSSLQNEMCPSERSSKAKRVFKPLNKRKNNSTVKKSDNYFTKDQQLLYATKKELDSTPSIDKPKIIEWKIMKQIGQGSFGKVYYVFDS